MYTIFIKDKNASRRSYIVNKNMESNILYSAIACEKIIYPEP
jgi:hypothetical protein